MIFLLVLPWYILVTRDLEIPLRPEMRRKYYTSRLINTLEAPTPTTPGTHSKQHSTKRTHPVIIREFLNEGKLFPVITQYVATVLFIFGVTSRHDSKFGQNTYTWYSTTRWQCYRLLGRRSSSRWQRIVTKWTDKGQCSLSSSSFS